MHTDQSQKRRTLLLLVLLLSSVILFDALMIFNRQEPQTYQSKASTIEESLPDARLVAADYATVSEFLDDVDLSADEYPSILTALRDQINIYEATATAALGIAFANLERQERPDGSTQFDFRQEDLTAANRAIINMFAPLQASQETFAHFADHASTVPSTVGPPLSKDQVQKDIDEFLKETDIDKIKTSEEADEIDAHIIDLMGQNLQVDKKPEIPGPLSRQREKLRDKRYELTLQQVKIIKERLKALEEERLKALEKEKTEAEIIKPDDQGTNPPETDEIKAMKRAAEIEAMRRAGERAGLENEIKKLTEQLEKANAELERVRKEREEEDKKKDSAEAEGKKAEQESAEKTSGSTQDNMCARTSKNESKNRFVCKGVVPGENCKSLSKNPSEKDKKDIVKYKCVKNDDATSIDEDTAEIIIVCDCLKQDPWWKKAYKKPYQLANKNWLTRVIAGIVVSGASAWAGGIFDGGGGGGGGMPIDQNP